jgi:hypothetical protein
MTLAGPVEQIAKQINLGVDANTVDGNGDLPLHLAVQCLDFEAARLLLAHGGADIDAEDAQGRTAIARLPRIETKASEYAWIAFLHTLVVLGASMRSGCWPLPDAIDGLITQTFARDAPREIIRKTADMLTFVRGNNLPTPACRRADAGRYESECPGGAETSRMTAFGCARMSATAALENSEA